MKTKRMSMALLAGALVVSGLGVATATPVDAASKKPVKAVKVVKAKKADEATEKAIKSGLSLAKAKVQFKKAGLVAKPFTVPVAGKITAKHGVLPYSITGTSQFHDGVDIANKKGVAVKASYDGKVVAVGYEENGRGNYVVIEHDLNGVKYQTVYAHLDKSNVKVGKTVKKGSAIGQMGMSGRAAGVHLHFAVLDATGTSINPEEVMQ